MPQGHLSVLRTHPTANLTIGARSLHNEWDFNLSGRFGSKANPYTLLRNDSLITQTFYDGFNAGLDYTHYFINHEWCDFGISGGIGAEGIGLVPDPKHSPWSPSSLTSPDLRIAIRSNMFFASSYAVAIAAGYNFLFFHNTGGTPLNGNAISVSIRVGYQEIP